MPGEKSRIYLGQEACISAETGEIWPRGGQAEQVRFMKNRPEYSELILNLVAIYGISSSFRGRFLMILTILTNLGQLQIDMAFRGQSAHSSFLPLYSRLAYRMNQVKQTKYDIRIILLEFYFQNNLIYTPVLVIYKYNQIDVNHL